MRAWLTLFWPGKSCSRNYIVPQSQAGQLVYTN